MSRATLVLWGNDIRQKASQWALKAPPGTRVEFRGPRRSLPQNARMHASLTDIATQVEWHGERLTTEEWKWLFLDALKRELRVVPNLDNTGFVNISRHSSDLSKEEMSGLLELIAHFGETHGVVFSDPEAQAAA